MATPSKSVQFRNAADTLNGYLSRDVPAFSVWCAKQFMFKYEGDSITEGEQELKNILQLLERNDSAAIYTLCVYEDLKGKIKDNTPYDGSFNFRLSEYASGFLPGAPGGMNALVTEVQALRLQVQKLQEDKDENEPDSQLGVIGEILDHPAVEPIVPIVVSRIVDMFLPEETAKTKRVSGINFNSISDDDKVRESLKKLSEQVDDLPDLLCKMALLSEKKPSSFKFYMSTLRAMKL